MDACSRAMQTDQAVRLRSADIEAIARRVAQLIDDGAVSTGTYRRYVDAPALALLLGVERDWVYRHAGEFGAIRLGGGRGRLRFDSRLIRHALAAGQPHTEPRSRRRPTHRRRRLGTQVELIPYES